MLMVPDRNISNEMNGKKRVGEFGQIDWSAIRNRFAYSINSLWAMAVCYAYVTVGILLSRRRLCVLDHGL